MELKIIQNMILNSFEIKYLKRIWKTVFGVLPLSLIILLYTKNNEK